MICLTFLNVYQYVKLLLPACAENAFAGNEIPAKIVTSCVKGLMCVRLIWNANSCKCLLLQAVLLLNMKLYTILF